MEDDNEDIGAVPFGTGAIHSFFRSFYGMAIFNKYKRLIHVKSGYIDVYDVLKAFNVTDQALGHAIKKLLVPGGRGHKTRMEDLKDAIASIQRAMEISEHEEDAKNPMPEDLPTELYAEPGDDPEKWARNINVLYAPTVDPEIFQDVLERFRDTLHMQNQKQA